MQPLQKRLGSVSSITVLNDNMICDGCGEKVKLMEMPILGGPDKGKIQKFKIGCKCEDKRLAEKAVKDREKKRNQKVIDQFQRFSLINPKLIGKTFDDYTPKNRAQALAKRTMKRYAEIFDLKKPRNLYCYGPFGTGKSHLAKVVTDKLMEKEFTCIFISLPRLFRKIKDTYNKESNISVEHIFSMMERVDCLVLDDYSSETPTKWTLEQIFNIIDARQGMHTIYTSNYSPKEILRELEETDDLRMQKQFERNFSRVLNEDTEIITFEGENHRWRKFHDQEQEEEEDENL